MVDYVWNEITLQNNGNPKTEELTQPLTDVNHTFLLCCFIADVDAQVQKGIKIAQSLQCTESSVTVSRRPSKLQVYYFHDYG